MITTEKKVEEVLPVTTEEKKVEEVLPVTTENKEVVSVIADDKDLLNKGNPNEVNVSQENKESVPVKTEENTEEDSMFIGNLFDMDEE